MEITTKKVTTTVYTYIANDGKTFNTERECKTHEFYNELRLKEGSVWAVYNKRKYRESIEIFSSEDLANTSLSYVNSAERRDYIVEELFIDIRFLAAQHRATPEDELYRY